jgi:hypothetical protein
MGQFFYVTIKLDVAFDEEESRLLDTNTLQLAQYAVGVTLITGKTEAAFAPENFASPDRYQDYLEVDNPKFFLGENYIISKNEAERFFFSRQNFLRNFSDPNFDFRKWLRQERKKNNKKSEIQVDFQQGILWLEKSALGGYHNANMTVTGVTINLMLLKVESYLFKWVRK